MHEREFFATKLFVQSEYQVDHFRNGNLVLLIHVTSIVDNEVSKIKPENKIQHNILSLIVPSSQPDALRMTRQCEKNDIEQTECRDSTQHMRQ